MNIDEAVTHLGDFNHEARYIDRLAKVEPEGASLSAPRDARPTSPASRSPPI